MPTLLSSDGSSRIVVPANVADKQSPKLYRRSAAKNEDSDMVIDDHAFAARFA